MNHGAVRKVAHCLTQEEHHIFVKSRASKTSPVLHSYFSSLTFKSPRNMVRSSKESSCSVTTVFCTGVTPALLRLTFRALLLFCSSHHRRKHSLERGQIRACLRWCFARCESVEIFLSRSSNKTSSANNRSRAHQDYNAQ